MLGRRNKLHRRPGVCWCKNLQEIEMLGLRIRRTANKNQLEALGSVGFTVYAPVTFFKIPKSFPVHKKRTKNLLDENLHRLPKENNKKQKRNLNNDDISWIYVAKIRINIKHYKNMLRTQGCGWRRDTEREKLTDST